MTRQPKSFDIPKDLKQKLDGQDNINKARIIDHPEVIIEDDPFDAVEKEVLQVTKVKKKSRWGALFWGALSALLSLSFALWVERLIRQLFQQAPWLGWVGLVLAGLVILLLLGFLINEIRAILRERKIEKLRNEAIECLSVNHEQKAKYIFHQILSLYQSNITKETIRKLKKHDDDILEADDRLALVEKTFLSSIDVRVKGLIAQSAKQVSVVTAVSPRAFIDIIFVFYSISRLLRQISALYGGRPGFFGFWRLFRLALVHLALTTGIAVGDSIAQDILGAGLAARLSSKLGEGILNGALTARFGLAAMSVCRPLPFIREPMPKFSDVAGELFSKKNKDGKPDGGE